VYEPTQVITYLGFILDSRNMTISLPAAKDAKIRTALQQALQDAEEGAEEGSLGN
jgi:hypothetical protein